MFLAQLVILHANTDVPAILVKESNQYQGPPLYAQTIGRQFAPLSEIAVTHLGFYDSRLNGLTDKHEVGIWENSGTLIVQATVPSGSSVPLIGNFRYVPVPISPPVTLLAGKTYVIGAFFYTSVDPCHEVSSLSSLTINPRIDPSSVLARESNSGTYFVMPPIISDSAVA